MRRSLVVAVLCAGLISSASCYAAEADPNPKVELVLALQAAVKSGDKAWLAAHLHLPVRYFGKRTMLIRSKEWFLSHYATVIGARLKASLLAQDPQNYLENYQGIMVGEGSHNVWLRDFGGESGPKFEIVTINNSDR